MAAVAAGHKDEWLALFAPDAVVEDPVGPSLLDAEGKGHHGHDGIARFWDQNFGAVSRFHFHVRDSFANGPCCANIVAITMWLGDDGTTMTVEGVSSARSGATGSPAARWPRSPALLSRRAGGVQPGDVRR